MSLRPDPDPLHRGVALLREHEEVVRALVAHGADVNGDTGSDGYPGRTPLYMVRKHAMVYCS